MPADVSSVVETHVALDQMHPPQHRSAVHNMVRWPTMTKSFYWAICSLIVMIPGTTLILHLGETENKLDRSDRSVSSAWLVKNF